MVLRGPQCIKTAYKTASYRSKPPEAPTGVAPEGPATQVRCAGPGCDITFMMTKLYNGSTGITFLVTLTLIG